MVKMREPGTRGAANLKPWSEGVLTWQQGVLRPGRMVRPRRHLKVSLLLLLLSRLSLALRIHATHPPFQQLSLSHLTFSPSPVVTSVGARALGQRPSVLNPARPPFLFSSPPLNSLLPSPPLSHTAICISLQVSSSHVPFSYLGPTS